MPEKEDQRWDAVWGDAVVNLALFGYLNPRIFVPSWFEHRELLTADDLKGAELNPDSPALVAFATGSFTLEVSLERYLIYGPAKHRARYRELTEATFSILSHTPLVGLGIGYEFWVPFESAEQRDHAFDRYAPTSAWAGDLPGSTERRLQIVVEGPEGGSSKVRVILENSTTLENALWIMVATEDLATEEERVIEGCDASIAALAQLWQPAEAMAEKVVRRMFEVS